MSSHATDLAVYAKSSSSVTNVLGVVFFLLRDYLQSERSLWFHIIEGFVHPAIVTVDIAFVLTLYYRGAPIIG